jgi:quercetin dioxygenase-like cupin family protein
MNATRLAASAAIAFVVLSPGFAVAQHGGHAHTFATAKDLKWNDTPSLPGAKVAVIEGPPNEAKPFIMRIRFPANYKIAPHYHSSIEHVTVISGEFVMAVSENAGKGDETRLQPGDVAIMQPKTPHYAYTTKRTEVQVHGNGPWTLTYVNPKDDPRKQ